MGRQGINSIHHEELDWFPREKDFSGRPSFWWDFLLKSDSVDWWGISGQKKDIWIDPFKGDKTLNLTIQIKILSQINPRRHNKKPKLHDSNSVTSPKIINLIPIIILTRINWFPSKTKLWWHKNRYR